MPRNYILHLQVSSDYRWGTGGRKSAPIEALLIRFLIFLTCARQKKSGQDTRASGSRIEVLGAVYCGVLREYFRITRIAQIRRDELTYINAVQVLY